MAIPVQSCRAVQLAGGGAEEEDESGGSATSGSSSSGGSTGRDRPNGSRGRLSLSDLGAEESHPQTISYPAGGESDTSLAVGQCHSRRRQRIPCSVDAVQQADFVGTSFSTAQTSALARSKSDMSSAAVGTTGHGRASNSSHPTTSAAAFPLNYGDETAGAEDSPKRGHGAVIRLPRLKLKGSGPSPSKRAKLGSQDMQAEFDLHRGNGGGAPIKRRPSWSRLNSAVKWLRPSNKSRNEDFIRLFGNDVPPGAVVIDDYSCALQRDILAHGRMYVSQEHYCFYANIFGWETFLVLPCKDVTSIVREKTAHVIPNAIKITACDEVSSSDTSNLRRNKQQPGTKHYFFTSFMSRETSFQVLMKVWQNVLIGSHMNPQHLRSYVCRQWGHKPDWEDAAESPYHPALSPGTLRSNAAYQNGKGLSVAAGGKAVSESSLERSPTGNTDSPPLASCSDEDRETDLGDTFDERDEEDEEWCQTECSCQSHLGNVLIDRMIKASPSVLFRLLYTPTPFISDFFKERGIFDVDMEKWDAKETADGGEGEGEGGEYRTVSYKMPMSIPMGPKFAASAERQHLLASSQRPIVYAVQVDVTSSVPMGNAFSTCVKSCITRGKEPGTSRLLVTGGIVFHKSLLSMMKRIIEKEAAAGMTRHYTALSHALDRHFKHSPSNLTAQRLPVNGRKQSGLSQTDSVDVTPDGSRRESALSTAAEDGVKNTAASQSTLETLSQSVSVLTSLPFLSLRALLGLAFISLLLFSCYQFGTSPSAVLVSPPGSGGDSVPYQPTPEAQAPAPPHPDAIASAQGWIDLLRLQHALHQQDLERWQGLLHATSATLNNVSSMLQRLLVKQAVILQVQLQPRYPSTRKKTPGEVPPDTLQTST